MSLAGPHGEAACRYCNTLVDLDENRRLVRHGRNEAFPSCLGSGTYAHTQQRENEELAFSSEPVMRYCPTCGQLVEIAAAGRHRSVWRYSYHKTLDLLPVPLENPWKDCPKSGHLVPRGQADSKWDGAPLD